MGEQVWDGLIAHPLVAVGHKKLSFFVFGLTFAEDCDMLFMVDTPSVPPLRDSVPVRGVGVSTFFVVKIIFSVSV